MPRWSPRPRSRVRELGRGLVWSLAYGCRCADSRGYARCSKNTFLKPLDRCHRERYRDKKRAEEARMIFLNFWNYTLEVYSNFWGSEWLKIGFRRGPSDLVCPGWILTRYEFAHMHLGWASDNIFESQLLDVLLKESPIFSNCVADQEIKFPGPSKLWSTNWSTMADLIGLDIANPRQPDRPEIGCAWNCVGQWKYNLRPFRAKCFFAFWSSGWTRHRVIRVSGRIPIPSIISSVWRNYNMTTMFATDWSVRGVIKYRVSMRLGSLHNGV